MLPSRHRSCSPSSRFMCERTHPDEETTDWRAVCGRTARTVRRAGTAKAVPDPYQANPNLGPPTQIFGGDAEKPQLAQSNTTRLRWGSSLVVSNPMGRRIIKLATAIVRSIVKLLPV